MEDSFDLALLESGRLTAAEELRQTNALTGRFSLSLSEKQIAEIVDKRSEALAATGRVEFGRGIIKTLIEAFCDSPFIDQANYEDTILELLDSFYYFKNESEDRIPDDELIAIMRHHFDTTCQGSLDYLSGTTLEDLCRNTRYGYETDDDGPMF
jgi:3',5'-cyclic AMP phosphodiesterase CpdA